MPLSWTIVHPITPESPLAGITYQELVQRRGEVILVLKGIDEGYMQQVFTRHSFRFDEIMWGARYARAFSSKEGSLRLDLNKLSDFTAVEAPDRLPS